MRASTGRSASVIGRNVSPAAAARCHPNGASSGPGERSAATLFMAIPRVTNDARIGPAAARRVTTVMIDVIEIKDFFDRDACAAIRAELSEAAGAPAAVLGRDAGGSVQPLVRRVTRVAIPPATRERVTQLLDARKDTLER